MIFTSLTGNKTGPTDIWSKEYTPSGPTSNYLNRSKVRRSKWIGPRNTLTHSFGLCALLQDINLIFRNQSWRLPI